VTNVKSFREARRAKAKEQAQRNDCL